MHFVIQELQYTHLMIKTISMINKGENWMKNLNKHTIEIINQRKKRKGSRLKKTNHILINQTATNVKKNLEMIMT